ncbi:MAG: hypothetical protein JWQ03_3158 [Variovorax sp.]|nr:hypothetical protein [Variovorax sp.]
MIETLTKAEKELILAYRSMPAEIARNWARVAKSYAPQVEEKERPLLRLVGSRSSYAA